ncbi:uncharacterized protein LOC141724589 isoform X1 [Apium graveolens]|uniref:uncharacterized protein LOC141724589 isoform X1 n=1 Tax=Apium graveolens TaxID=4045 RepID=UPI003D79570D
MSSSSQPPTSLYLSRDHSETLTRALLRLAAGKMMISMLIQHSYITFSKEEEVIRCIQSVHGFVLEGNFLRYLGDVAIPCATGAVWQRRQLFVATPTTIEFSRANRAEPEALL